MFPATDLEEPVCLTVANLSQCGAEAETSECIPDVEPGDPTNLAVVGLGIDGVVGPMESDSELDSPGDYVGTNPIVIDSYIVADGETHTTILDDSDGCCDLQVSGCFHQCK